MCGPQALLARNSTATQITLIKKLRVKLGSVEPRFLAVTITTARVFAGGFGVGSS